MCAHHLLPDQFLRVVQRLATACLDGKVRIFDASNGRELLSINAHGDMTVNCVRLSPNGEQILSGSYDKVGLHAGYNFSIQYWRGGVLVDMLFV